MQQNSEQLEQSVRAYAAEWSTRQVERAVASAQRTVGLESFVANIKQGLAFREAAYKSVLPTFRTEAALRREIATTAGVARIAQVQVDVEARIAVLRKMTAA